MNRWDSYFFNLAYAVGENSQCLSRKIGAILVRDHSIIATGYNGPARGIPHCDEAGNIICPRQKKGYLSGQGLELCPAEHAERNTIANAARLGVSTLGATLYMTCPVPCKNCLTLIINAGIIEIVCNGFTLYDSLSHFIINNSALTVRDYEGNPYGG